MIRRSEVANAYSDSVGNSLAYLDAMVGRQPGDPARPAKGLLKVVDAPEPTLGFLLGSDALRGAREKLGAVSTKSTAIVVTLTLVARGRPF